MFQMIVKTWVGSVLLNETEASFKIHTQPDHDEIGQERVLDSSSYNVMEGKVIR